VAKPETRQKGDETVESYHGTSEEMERHRRRQVEELTKGACDAFRRMDVNTLGRILEIVTRV
jgi:hypothetical protein